MDDSDEEQEEDEDMLLACVMVGEYLAEKEERPKLCMLTLLHLEEQMILQHLEKQFSQRVQKLPLRKFFISDNSYVCSETLKTSFLGLK